MLAVAGVVWIGFREGTIRLEEFIGAETWWLDAALGAVSAVALLGVWEGGRRFFAGARLLEERLGELLGRLQPAEAAALAILSGFGEEVFFRGAVQGSWGWLAATVLFALLHTGPGKEFRAWTLFAALAGAALGGLMIWRGNLLAPVVAHALLNGVNLARIGKREHSPATQNAPPGPTDSGNLVD